MSESSGGVNNTRFALPIINRISFQNSEIGGIDIDNTFLYFDVEQEPPSSNEIPRQRRIMPSSQDYVIDLHEEITSEEEVMRNAEEQRKTLSPFVAYFKGLNCFGLTPFSFYHDDNFERKISCCKMCPYIVLQTLIGLFTLILFRRHIMFGVYLTEAETTNIADYIGFAQLLIQALLRIAFIYTLITRFSFYKPLLQFILSSEYFDEINTKLNFVLTGLTITFSVLIALLQATFPAGFPFNLESISFEAVCEYRRKDFVASLTASSFRGYLQAKNETNYHDLDDKTLSNEIMDIGFGFSLVLIAFLSKLIEQSAKGLVFITSLILKRSADRFHYLIPDGVSDEDDRNHDDIVQHYRQLKKLSKLLNKPIHVIYPLYLADNLLMVAAFYSSSLHPDVSTIEKITTGLCIAAMAITFYCAERSSNRMSQFKEWLRDESEFLFGREEALHLRDELTTNPVGIGKDILYIDKGFIFNFLFMSLAYFLSIVETRPKDN